MLEGVIAVDVELGKLQMGSRDLVSSRIAIGSPSGIITRTPLYNHPDAWRQYQCYLLSSTLLFRIYGNITLLMSMQIISRNKYEHATNKTKITLKRRAKSMSLVSVSLCRDWTGPE